MKIKHIYLIIFFIFIFDNYVECKKLYMLKHYENEDCTGTIYLYQVLLTVKEYQFQLPTIEDYYKLTCMGGELDEINNNNSSNYACYVEGFIRCLKDPDNCREYYEINKCNKGKKLVVETLDYLEKDYCTCTETIRTHNFIDEQIIWEGVQIIRRNYCHLGFTLDCNYFKFELTECETGKSLFLTNGSQKYLETSILNPNVMVTYRPNDPDYYKNTLMTHKQPELKILTRGMLTDDQLMYVRNPSAGI
ncbi:hypothetical protein DICPUDRAFT_81825 [Dictyostelium purpureum]|uniref:Uncharacterized protein n=1 Tax=Dictyostelium purpureum TaxID=5786 RepID=F0ZUP8_DICPU|nr:uncharacterized protein DICPUDRAFT_81825 [Dictyostelium purpureum]EGC32335.1 hypothetical protein DICPUDRAFT_81825 [Dictyostelium purpureum]|eukprot:XP_003291137.1 hypothetical protein DICPUDRAFT_81825 [Dictyostelium purpureum]